MFSSFFSMFLCLIRSSSVPQIWLCMEHLLELFHRIKKKNTGKSFQISIVFCRKIAHDELYRHICDACVFVCTIVERIVKWIELISSNSVSIQLLPYCNYLKVFLFHTHADSLSVSLRFRFFATTIEWDVFTSGQNNNSWSAWKAKKKEEKGRKLWQHR